MQTTYRIFATVLSLATVAAVGCRGESQRPHELVSEDIAINQYKSALATTCPAKHLDTMSPADLNLQVKKWHMTLDAPAQEMYDHATHKACKANATMPDCENTGTLQALNQDGTMNKFATQVCGPTPQ